MTLCVVMKHLPLNIMKSSFLLVPAILLLLPLTIAAQQPSVKNVVRYDGVVTVQDLHQSGQAVHPAAARAMARGEKPGTFRNVRYELAPNVKMLTPAQKSRIRLQQDGILDLSGGGFKPSPDSVYLDPESDLVMQAEPVDDSRMLALRPSMSAVFQDIDVPEQEVPVTLANTVSMADGIIESSMQLNNKYAVNLRFDSVTYVLDKTDKDSLLVTLVGQILLTNPRVEGKYSKNNGYRLVFLASEQVDMKIYTSMKLKEESKTPIWGTEIEMSDLGKCEIGLFILATLEGHVTLAVEIHQGIEMAMGAKGSTVCYIPTSIKNVSTIDSWCDIDYDITSQMKAFLGFQCTANLKVKGYNALDVYVNGGMEGTVATDGMTLDADVGLRLKAGGKIVSKKFTLIDSYYSLWKYKKPDFHGYSMVIHEACAWGDYVAGEVHSLVPGDVPGVMDTVPYRGNLTVIVRRPDNGVEQFTATAGDDGIFIARNVPLKNGDRVKIKLPDVPNPSPELSVTIPFREVKLYSADYYTGVAEGSVAGSRSKWAKLAGAQQGSSAAAAAVAGTTPAGRFKGAIPQQESIRRLNEFKNSLTVYRGPIEFITSTGPEVTLTGGPLKITGTQGTAQKGSATQGSRSTSQQGTGNASQQRTASGNAAQQGAAARAAAQGPGARGTVTAGSGAPANIPSSAGKALANRGTVNNPLGMYSVSGLTLEPGQKVKARIEVEGFIVESEWTETDGLMVSSIEHDNFRVSARPGSETFSADSSFVIVSAVRGETSPEGTVTVMQGADAPHASLTSPQTVPEVPEAKKARVWFRKDITLVPLAGNPGAAIASTGPWSMAYGFSSPGDALNPLKNRMHPFELVTFVYKGKNLGHSVSTDECASCTAPANVIDRIGRGDLPGRPAGTGRPATVQAEPGAPAVKPGQQVRQPVVIR